MFPPSPPGDTIRDIMEDRVITRFELACALDITSNNVLNLINGTLRITPELAQKLSEALGSTKEFWENREKQYREALLGVRK